MGFEEIKELPHEERSRFGEIVFRGSIGSMFNLQHFNADPHPGNYILMEDGRVAFLDFGMTKKLDREQILLEQRAFDAASRDDPEAFRQALHDLGFVKKPSKLDAERLLEHMGAVGGWYIEDREIEITPQRVMKIIESTNDPRSEYFDLMRRESIPAEELMGRRMEIGVVAVLGQLRAKRNWHRIFREWVYADGRQPSSASRNGSTSRKEDSSERPDWPKPSEPGLRKPRRNDAQDQTRLGSDQEKLGAAERAPRADPVPALRGGGDDAAGDRLPRPRALPAGQRPARRRDPDDRRSASTCSASSASTSASASPPAPT